MKYKAVNTNGRLTLLNDGSFEVCFKSEIEYVFGEWQEYNLPFNTKTTLCYAQNKWIIVGNVIAVNRNHVFYNSDISNTTGWTDTYTIPGNINVYSSFADDTGFLIGAENGLYYSPDGINWSVTSISGSTSVFYHSIAGISNKYVVIEKTSNPDKIYYSTDMINWINSYDITGTTSFTLRFANDKFYCLRRDGNIYYSTDAISWNSFTISGIPKPIDISYGNGKYLILDETNSSGATSTDGINWSVFTTGLPSSLSGLYYMNGKFFISSFPGSLKIHSSSNGLDWSPEDDLDGWGESVVNDNVLYNNSGSKINYIPSYAT